jgi:hypothetical protein
VKVTEVQNMARHVYVCTKDSTGAVAVRDYFIPEKIIPFL